jgi:hypothetical protein
MNDEFIFTIIGDEVSSIKNPLNNTDDIAEVPGSTAAFEIIGFTYLIVPFILLKLKFDKDIFNTFSKLQNSA